MKSLITIQKTFKVFKTLSMIAMIVSFIAAGTALLGLFCVIEWQSAGMLGFGRSVMEFAETTSLEPAICALLSDAVFALTDGFLCLFAWNYFKMELADGTPFTHSGADKVRSLGIQTIVMPPVAVIISAVIYSFFGMTNSADSSNAVSVVLGIVMILASLVFHYGAELEMKMGEIIK
ncbi:MAG: hypothetical protein Q4P20_11990 [Eubacteriales bacterium]|nr:hypothetical protein [Eubacteriales bacterium]